MKFESVFKRTWISSYELTSTFPQVRIIKQKTTNLPQLAFQTVWFYVSRTARMWWMSQHLMCWQCPQNAAPALDETVKGTNQCFSILQQLISKWKTRIKTFLTLEICEWNSVMFWPSIWPNLLSTSLCQESYFKFTFDCTYKWIM